DLNVVADVERPHGVSSWAGEEERLTASIPSAGRDGAFSRRVGARRKLDWRGRGRPRLALGHGLGGRARGHDYAYAGARVERPEFALAACRCFGVRRGEPCV